MTKDSRARHKCASRQGRSSPYPLPHCDDDVQLESMNLHKDSNPTEKKDWEDAICPICMECPHNAVLLLCSSHDKGCRPYMCDTSFRHSNCLDQFKKAYTKLTLAHGDSISSQPAEKSKVPELACPLCRGLVKGWTVVESAREYLNAMRRGCMQDSCLFSGTYRELRKHMRRDHPTAAPRAVDPALQEEWRRLEHDRQQEDIISMVRSSLPGAMVVGDYAIGGGANSGGYNVNVVGDDVYAAEVDADFLNVVFYLNAFVEARIGNAPRQERRQAANGGPTTTRFPSPGDDFDAYVEARNSGGGISLAQRLRRQGRVLLGRSERRRRLREASGDGR